MAKRFAYVSFGVLCLAVAALIFTNLTTRDVQAQAGQIIAAYAFDGGRVHTIITPSGDVFALAACGPDVTVGECYNVCSFNAPAVYMGNFWTGEQGPVPTSSETWGGIKGLYDEKK